MPAAPSLDHVTAILEEVAALARAGVPLEKGLLGVSRDLPRKLRSTTEKLAQRLHGGETLPEALDAEQEAFPPVFRAVVTAGLRSGNLAPAVEGLVAVSRRLADMRRNVQLAFVYPFSLVVLAYALLIVFVVVVAPAMVDMLRDPGPSAGAGPSWTADALTALADTVIYWGPVFPALFLLAVAWSSLASRRASLLQASVALRLFGWLPWCAKLVQHALSALVCDVLALLLEREVPLDQAILLAAESAGKPRQSAAAAALAERIRQGESEGIEQAACVAAGFPPSVAWLLKSRYAPSVVLAGLRRAAQTHAQRADDLASELRLWLPVTLVLVIGGGVALVYALAIVLPWIAVIREMLSHMLAD